LTSLGSSRIGIGIVGLSALRIGWCAIPADVRLLDPERDEPRVSRSIAMSFLELEGLHVFVTGAAGGIGSAIVDEFLGRYGNSWWLFLHEIASAITV
jgi:hypothetical protein